MKLTLGWLKSHLDTDLALPDLVRHLTMIGLEVDRVEDRAAALAPFRTVRVLSAVPHPNADKLRVCRVDTGAGELQVVCGAPNARAGMAAVLAPVGSTIPTSGLVLKASQIRGEASQGMLCSAFELGLSEDHTGIIELDPETPPGQPFAAVAGLDDPLLDVKVTPNRADCLSVRGIARDLAAGGFGRLKPLAADPVPGMFPCPVTVTIAPDAAAPEEAACPLFLGRVVRGVSNGPSPQWLRDRLTAIGLRPISTLVDITNFMTFDLGRPLHVFDADKVAGGLTVRLAQAGEELRALNGKSYALDPGMTVIADAEGVESLGGVMGGEASGCTSDTTAVFIEAALFDPRRTAATGRKLMLESDARYRFERGLDLAFTRDGLEIATRLVLELCGGQASDVVSAGAEPAWQRTLTLRPERVLSLGGLDVPATEASDILTRLGCLVTAADGRLTVVPPSWRADIEGEADLVEEVLRLHGYDDIPVVPLTRTATLPRPALDPGQRRASLARRTLAARGLAETVTYSFVSSRQAALFGGGQPELTVSNPISADLDAMRPSILPTLLSAAARNGARGHGDLALFEVGPQYAGDAPDQQRTMASGVRTGRSGPAHWATKPAGVDALAAKADLLALLAALDVAVESAQLVAEAPAWYHPGRAGTLRLGPKTILGTFGEVHPRVAEALDLKGPAVAFECFLDALPPVKRRVATAFTLPVLQPVDRDFAFVVPAEAAAETLLRAARTVDRKLVTDVRLFDVYTGAGLPAGTKSLAIAVTLQPERTLTDAELQDFCARLVAAVEKATGGALRR